MKRSNWVLIATVSLLAAGCAKDTPPGGYGAAASDQAEAERQFQAAHNNPITAQTHFAAGQLDESEGNAAGAISQYTAALDIDPLNVPTLFRLAFVYTSHEQYPQAIAIWQRYTRATGGSAAAYSNLGYCLEVAGQTAEAEATYEIGIAKDPTDQACRVNYGLMLARLNRPVEAADQLKLVLTPAEVHYNLASVLESQGKKDKARAEYAKALELNPDLSDARARIAGL